MFLRNELCSNNLYDFGLKKGLDHLDEVRQRRFKTIISRFAGFQAQWLNVHTDFPPLQRMALPVTVGSVRHPGIKIHDTRIIRLLEVLLHADTHVGGWTAREIHEAVLSTFHLSADAYGLNQLRYDLRKLKGHGLLERDGTRYAYLLTPKGFRSHCSSCSSTSACADRSPTVASTTGQTPNIGQTAGSKPPTTALTKPSKKSSISWPRLDLAAHHSAAKTAAPKRKTPHQTFISARKIAGFWSSQTCCRPQP
jgi:hypothetical protein